MSEENKILNLSEDLRDELMEIANNPNYEPRLRNRSKMILLSADGKVALKLPYR